jgi:hypothetical protein
MPIPFGTEQIGPDLFDRPDQPALRLGELVSSGW